MIGAQHTGVLDGVTVVVTRARAQAADLVSMLESHGACVLSLPVIALADPDDWGPADSALDTLPTYDWVVFTSANALDRFLGRAVARGMDEGRLLGELAECRIAAVGPATAARCEAAGVRTDYVPEEAVAEGLVEGFAALGLGHGTRVLLPRALEAREVLPDALRAAGAVIDVVPVYRTVPADPDPDIVQRIADGDADVVTFTSPSTVRNFFGMLKTTTADRAARELKAVSIGPVTSEALRRIGIEPFAEAPEHTSAGLVGALVQAMAGPPTSG